MAIALVVYSVGAIKFYQPSSVISRVHNKRREGEYPTSIVLPNALCKVMTYQPVATLGVECFDMQHQSKRVLFYAYQ